MARLLKYNAVITTLELGVSGRANSRGDWCVWRDLTLTFLQGNSIGEAGGREVARALEHNSSIIALNLGVNNSPCVGEPGKEGERK